VKKAFLVFSLFISVMAFGQLSLDPCILNHNFHIVVLGSSTAAGTGPSHQDSAWVNRYRSALQKLNSQIQVSNLAQGGYTTYKLMPNNFVAAANRPTVDTNKNITAAFKLNPDAIIINLPSNDRQWPMAEQLANFDSLYKHSVNNGIAFFVCSTQPIVTASFASYQRAVRDSIMAQYASFAIDLFLPLSDSNNTVLAQYAADAVHLNDSGHAVIFNQIWNADVLSKSFIPRTSSDLGISGFLPMSDLCADSTKLMAWLITNFGDTVHPGTIGYVKSTGTLSDSTNLILTKTLMPCSQDTLWTTVNAGLPGSYSFQANITWPGDTFYANNQYNILQDLVTSPRMKLTNDTLCKNDYAHFSHQLLAGDTVLWYRSALDSIPIATGNSFPLVNDTSLFAQGVSGKLSFESSLSTSNNANINFQGNMFDLLPTQDLSLEKLEVRLSGTGATPLKVYFKHGSYRGHENIAGDWSLYYHDTVTINQSGDFVVVDLADSTYLANDTLGVYVQVSSGSNRVMYTSGNQVASYVSKALQFISGSGIAGNFASSYNHRTLNLKAHYSYGFNPLGLCATPRKEVRRVIDTSTLNLGPDLLISAAGIILNTGATLRNHCWINLSTGDTLSKQAFLLIDSTLFQSGFHQIRIGCFGQSEYGCDLSDSLICTLENIGLREYDFNRLKIYPNPTSSVLNLDFENTPSLIQLFSLSRHELIRVIPKTPTTRLNIEGLAPGVYIVSVLDAGETLYRKVIIN
tara:strand:+ start:6922 stop:9153 length:2232 start_codon:yes stop_codon:yes gene_type:complete